MKKIITIFKIISLIFFSSVIFYIKNEIILTVLFILLLIILRIVPTKRPILERLKLLIPIGLLIFLFQIVFNQSLTLPERFLFGYLVFLRIVLVSLLVLLFTSLTSPKEIVSAFSFLPQQFQLLLMITFYLIPLIFDEWEKILLVQKSRGLGKGNFIPVLIPLLHRIFQRAETLALTVVSRGYEE